MWNARERTIIVKNETVLGRKLPREKWELSQMVKNWKICWDQMTLMWISDESCKKEETKKGAQYLRPLAQMVQVSSWWSASRDGTSSKESGTHLGDTIRRPVQVMDGGKRAWNSRELDGARWKKGLWRQRKITWRNAPT